MRDIKDLTLEELESVFQGWGVARFHARQVLNWIYHRGASDFNQMSDVSLEVRRRLKGNFYILGFTLTKILTSRDGTQKLLLELSDKNLIEAVTIPTEDRVTACLSSQVGCKFACCFCASGLLGFKRDLTCGEILEELWQLKNSAPKNKITHVVFMGTGEPLDNYDNVLKALRIINARYGFNIGARRITISTSGLIPGIQRLAGEGVQIELSVSLHAGDDALRSRLMPINKKFPLKELIACCKEYVKKTKRQLTFEYALIKGVNSDLPNADKISKMLQGFDCKMNLIVCNAVKELGLEPPGKLEILLFKDALVKSGLQVTLRKSRGQDIEAACGQLRLQHGKA